MLVGAGPQQHQGFPRQLGEGDGLAAGKGVVPPDAEHRLGIQYPDGVEMLHVALVHGDDGGIQQVLFHHLHQLEGALLKGLQANLRVEFGKLLEDHRKEEGADHRRDADLDMVLPVPQVPHPVDHAFRPAQQVGGHGQEDLPLPGDAQLAVDPLEQADPELLLQVPDGVGDRGLGDMEGLGGPGDIAAVAAYAGEVLKLVQLQGGAPPFSASGVRYKKNLCGDRNSV